MYVFTTFLSDPIPRAYQACIESILAVYPGLEIVTEAGEAFAAIADVRERSDLLRLAVMARYEEALYIDPDVWLKSAFRFPATDRPWFPHWSLEPDYYLMYHKGQQAFFQAMLEYYEKHPLKFGWICGYLRLRLGQIHLIRPGNGEFVHKRLTGNGEA